MFFLSFCKTFPRPSRSWFSFWAPSIGFMSETLHEILSLSIDVSSNPSTFTFSFLISNSHLFSFCAVHLQEPHFTLQSAYIGLCSKHTAQQYHIIHESRTDFRLLKQHIMKTYLAIEEQHYTFLAWTSNERV